jgi:hypothetical protein
METRPAAFVGIMLLIVISCGALFELNPAVKNANATTDPSATNVGNITGYPPNVNLVNTTINAVAGSTVRIIFNVTVQHSEPLYMTITGAVQPLSSVQITNSADSNHVAAGVDFQLPMGSSVSVSKANTLIPVLITLPSNATGSYKLQAVFFQSESRVIGNNGGSGTIVPFMVDVMS